MFPVVPLLSLAGIVGGAVSLAWYHRLSPAQKAEADRVAAEYAWEEFRKRMTELAAPQARQVLSYARSQFDN